MSSGRIERAFRSTEVRLTTWYVAVFLVSFAAVAGVAEYFITRAVAVEEQATVTTRLDEYRAEFEARGVGGVSRAVSDRSTAEERETVVITQSGRPIYESKPNAAETSRNWRVAMTTLSGDVELRVARSKADERALLERVRDGSLAALGVALILGIAGGALLTRRALRPVAELKAVTATILGSGKLDARVPTRGTGDDLDELATQFNAMLARNESLVTGMRDALDNVAHDLRTPLTRLRAGAELALKTPTEAAMRDALGDSIDETDRVLSMLHTLMDISAAEAGAIKLERAAVDLDRIAREVLDTYDLVAEERGVRIVASLEPARASGDAPRLRQLVANLVDNALKYTPTGGLVEVRTRAAPNGAEVQVRDSGVGISERDLPHVFERLYRGDRSRSETGLGLGLSFVKAICEAHGGTVTVNSAPGEGAVFTVTVPAVTA